MNWMASLRRIATALLVITAFGAHAVADAAARPARPLIVFMTDFGVIDDAVAICKGVMLGIAPQADIIDLTHQVTPFSIADGARFLARTAPYYPRGTVFVTVVDPGVGTSRKSIVVKTKRGQYFVLPDNGLVTPLADRDGIEGVREIKNRAWLYGDSLSSTFHGRDVYSPVAAHLARGEDWTKVGPAIAAPARLEVPQVSVTPDGLSATVVGLDGPFGNLVTNVDAATFRGQGHAVGDAVRVRVGTEELTVPFVATFGDVPRGAALLFIDSRGLVSLALNQGSFAQAHHVAPPTGLLIYAK